MVLDGTGSITIVAMATVQRDRGEAERGKKIKEDSGLEFTYI